MPLLRIARIDAALASLFPIQNQRCLTKGTHMKADDARTRMPPTVLSDVEGRGERSGALNPPKPEPDANDFELAAALAAAAAPESTTTTCRGKKALGHTGERSHIEMGRPKGKAECGS
mgnify:CR=1 FL=1